MGHTCYSIAAYRRYFRRIETFGVWYTWDLSKPLSTEPVLFSEETKTNCNSFHFLRSKNLDISICCLKFTKRLFFGQYQT